MIEHRRNAIETESIEFEFFEPISNIRQKKSHNFTSRLQVIFGFERLFKRSRNLLHVIETSTIPQTMMATCIIMEKTTRCTIKHVQSVFDVFAAMAVHQIQENCQTMLMSLINQSFQFFWSTIAAKKFEM